MDEDEDRLQAMQDYVDNLIEKMTGDPELARLIRETSAVHVAQMEEMYAHRARLYNLIVERMEGDNRGQADPA